MLAGNFEVVPLVGPILGAIPAVLIALTNDTRLVDGVLLAPVIILTQTFGLLGLVVAPVLAAVLQICFQYRALRREEDLRLGLVSEEISQLQSGLLRVRQRIGSLESGTAPEPVNLAERLQELVDKTTGCLVESSEIALPANEP